MVDLHTYDHGDGDLVVMWHHGTPNVGAPPAPLFAAAERLGIRFIGYDRPGYGGSAPRPDRTIASAATDAAAVADALGVGRFAVLGHSGGGPHALACAALLPDRVTAAVSISGMAPRTADGLDWFAGMGPGSAGSLRAAAAGRAAKEAHEPSDDIDFTAADWAALDGEWGWFGSVVTPALANGPAPLNDDDLAYAKDWGFDPAVITAPVLLVHGDDDRMVPSSHSTWLAGRIPSAELVITPGAGHIFSAPGHRDPGPGVARRPLGSRGKIHCGRRNVRALLTSSGITNGSIRDALVALLGKPIAESDALFIPTAIYPFPGGPGMAWRALGGQAPSPLCDLGWKSLGILELTALPHIDEAAWVPTVRDADALLVWGGDPLFLANWMRRSGLTDLLPTLRSEAVYVGVSAGSIALADTFVETFVDPPRASDGPLKSEDIVFTTPQGDVDRILVTGQGAGLVDFAVIPHLEHPHHLDASLANAEKWAAHIPAPTYAIDDETAISVVDGVATVVSEGQWKLFQP